MKEKTLLLHNFVCFQLHNLFLKNYFTSEENYGKTVKEMFSLQPY